MWCGLRSFVRVENPPLDPVRPNPMIDNVVKAIRCQIGGDNLEGFSPVLIAHFSES